MKKLLLLIAATSMLAVSFLSCSNPTAPDSGSGSGSGSGSS